MILSVKNTGILHGGYRFLRKSTSNYSSCVEISNMPKEFYKERLMNENSYVSYVPRVKPFSRVKSIAHSR